jgi:DNA-binding transcriptional LysR family regulator
MSVAWNLQLCEDEVHKRISKHELGDWDDLRFFLAVAQTGSFTAAARLLGTNQTTVGRRMQAFEMRLGAKLFDRYSKGMSVTPVGRSILDLATQIEGIATRIDRRFAGADFELAGTVRIACTEGLGAYWLTPRMVGFQRAHPNLTIDIFTGNELADLSRREADVSIRLSQPTDPRLVAWKAGRMRFSLFAARSYTDVYGIPETLEDLSRHRLVDHDGHNLVKILEPWNRIVRQHKYAIFRTNSTQAQCEAVRCGVGISLSPSYTPRFITDLVELPVDPGCSTDIWLVTHEETNQSARVQRVLQHIRENFERDRREWFS